VIFLLQTSVHVKEAHLCSAQSLDAAPVSIVTGDAIVNLFSTAAFGVANILLVDLKSGAFG
jgi:hypothetical protein